MFILNNQINTMLISEIYHTKKHYFKISSYSIYHIQMAQDMDIAIIIKNTASQTKQF
jgi:hypothetical protein